MRTGIPDALCGIRLFVCPRRKWGLRRQGGTEVPDPFGEIREKSVKTGAKGGRRYLTPFLGIHFGGAGKMAWGYVKINKNIYFSVDMTKRYDNIWM